jgi:DNA segregation ATPase FtsK/SpoIIIE-like protein
MANLVSHTPYEQKNWLRLQDKYALSDVSQNPAEKLDDSGIQKHLADGQQVAIARRQADRADRPADDLLDQARQVWGGAGPVSVSALQRGLGVGYGRAIELADRLEREGKSRPA